MPLYIGNLVYGQPLAERLLNPVLRIRSEKMTENGSSITSKVIENFVEMTQEPQENIKLPAPTPTRLRFSFLQNLGITQTSVVHPPTGYVIKQVPPQQKVMFLQRFRQAISGSLIDITG
jgi:uncharacterized FlaG/YvyC family protein